MLLKNGTFMILEYNREPSLSLSNEVDEKLKIPLVEEIFKLVGINSYLNNKDIKMNK